MTKHTMNDKNMRKKNLLLALATVLIIGLSAGLSACGGGDDNDEPDGPEVPVTPGTPGQESSYADLIIGKWMLPADWGEAYLFKANGTAKGYEMDDNGNLKETWDNIWAIKGDKLYITEDYDDDPYDKPETSVLEIINITSSKAVLYDAADNETIVCTKVSIFPWE